MAVDVTFTDDKNDYYEPILKVNSDDKFIDISIEYLNCPLPTSAYISLDKKSAIRLAKELRKQISFLED
ncbi:MAG: hypothetical protein EBS55_03105 [Flavobacteriaceae bacterium]|nr:hypothetical protein [Flavobacteriaceae bacterium]